MPETIDKNSFFKKAGRSLSLSSNVVGLGLKLAGEKFLNLDIDKSEHSIQLMQVLGNLKGPIMKVGQILATIPEALPPEYAKALQELQSNAPAMGWPFVRRRMKTELGTDWQSRFSDFPRTATAAASLGQVHKATTTSGDRVACKLQYPDMGSAVDSDLKQLKLAFKIYKNYDRAIQTDQIHAELTDRLKEELDYKREARAQKLYAHLLKDEKNIHVPKVFDDLSTDRLLTTQWMDGHKILSYVDAPLEERNTIATNLFRAWYVPLYKSGIIHGDPHLGNYTIRDDLSVNLLDFGCVRIFNPEFIQGVIDLYRALQNDDVDMAVHAYQTWGFRDLDTDTIDILNIWARFLYQPLLDDQARKIGESKGGVYGREIAQKVHKHLREKRADLAVPREFVFMDRAALGLGSVFIHLQAEINWYQLFHSLIEDFNTDDLRINQQKLLTQFDLQ